MSTAPLAMIDSLSVAELVARARKAQVVYETFDQQQVDAIVRDMAKFVYDNAEPLARMAVEETGVGRVDDKIAKNQGKARAIWNSLKARRSRGIIDEDRALQLTYIAKPVGVVGAVTPITNPVVTPMCNGMFALKTGNAIIFAPHPKARGVTIHLVDAFMDIVRRHGGPENLVQVLPEASVDSTQALMQAADVIVATGGGPMVKAAYSSGRPSYGVGAGNVPVIVDRDVDLAAAVDKIVTGASFDNGIICSHEQFVLVPEDDYGTALAAFRTTDRVWYTGDAVLVNKFRDIVFPNGQLNKDIVGKDPQHIAALAGVELPVSIRLILLPAVGAGRDDVLAKEKLCPVIAMLPYAGFDEAIALARDNLLVEGAGHSAALHSNNEDHIRRAGLELPVSRLVVNQPCSLTAGGSLTNGFAPTTTLGCGSWGGNSISENLDFKHLMNVSQIGRVIADRAVPSDEEIFAVN